MALKKHHKWLIGSFTSVVILFIIASSTFSYLLFLNQEYNFNLLNDKIETIEANTNSQLDTLGEGLFQTNRIVDEQFSSLNDELVLLKASTSADFSGIIENAIKSVVTIRTSAGFQGTGFIIEESGYVVTNAHVLADSSGKLADSIQTIDFEKRTKSAQFIDYNSELDLALLKISGTYEILNLGDSENIQVGEKVIAIGNPLGLQFSVSEGIVSAVHREGINGIEAYIQTDTALNPGNSGGPLISKNGEVIGINNFKISSGENLGFALESNYIEEFVNEIYFELNGENLI
ncbi:MAG: trypsin-like peptidase domain-containing protein [Candidatus Pacearchaeota archaeon]